MSEGQGINTVACWVVATIGGTKKKVAVNVNGLDYWAAKDAGWT
jgi:hypothetical protein